MSDPIQPNHVATPTPTPVVEPAAETETPLKKTKAVSMSEAEIKKIQHRIRLTLEIGGLTILAGAVLNFVVMYMTNKQMQQFRMNRQQISAALYNSSDIQNTVSFLEEQKHSAEIINQALPNEVGFFEFVRTLELISSQHSQDSRFSFEKGTSEDNIPFVPLQITMTTDNSNLIEFLKKIEKVPYLLQFNSIETQTVFDSNGLWKVRLDGRVYVNPKFRLEAGATE